jgi:hypothetical protein
MHPFTSAAVLVASALWSGQDAARPGEQLVYRGEVALVADDRTVADPEKTFDLTWLVTGAGNDASQVWWLVEEHGRGGWPWIERFGRLALGDDGAAAGSAGPSLLYDYDTGTSVVELPAARLLGDVPPLAEGVAWESGDSSYVVEAAEERLGRSTWRVNVTNRVGPWQTLWVENQMGLVVAGSRLIFMDRGTEYVLSWELAAQESLLPEDLAALEATFDALARLRSDLNRPARTPSAAFSADELATIEAALPAIADQAAPGVLSRLAAAASEDVAVQRGRADGVDSLQAKFEGKFVEEFADLAGLGSAHLSRGELLGQVTVLHFWDYRDNPLTEPYGQVGYLDFLYSRRQADGVRVYGVAVDTRLADEATRGEAVSSIRKFRSFMNLSYPIVFDDGALVQLFGDPRSLGAELPLFVVIGPDETIAKYHVGYFEVDRDRGLAQLDDAVEKLVDSAGP